MHRTVKSHLEDRGLIGRVGEILVIHDDRLVTYESDTNGNITTSDRNGVPYNGKIEHDVKEALENNKVFAFYTDSQRIREYLTASGNFSKIGQKGHSIFSEYAFNGNRRTYHAFL
jgi:hypothetical protein